MDKKQNVISFLTQVIAVYGSVILFLNILCPIVGDNAAEYSTIFSIGKNGIGVLTNIQFFAMSLIIVALRSVFLTDCIIKNASATLRTALMFAAVFAVAVIFIMLCGWFSADNLTAWLMFILSFGISGITSTLLSARREKAENEILNIALNKIKEEL